MPFSTKQHQTPYSSRFPKFSSHPQYAHFVLSPITAGGKFDGASDKITIIDKSNAAYDSITLAAAIGAIAKDMVLVTVKAKTDAGSAEATVETSEVAITMAKVDLTVANQSCGLMVRGTIEERNMPFPLDADLKKLMPLIRFV